MWRAIVAKLAGVVHALTPSAWLPQRRHTAKLTELIEVATRAASAYGDIAPEGGARIDLPSVDGRVMFRRLHDGVVQISVRGTANAKNVITDLSARRVQDVITGKKFHEGFLTYAKEAWQQINPLLTQLDDVEIEGHSLGGAVAQILGAWCQFHGVRSVRCVTFGAPMVGDRAAAELCDKSMQLTRIVNDNDVIPLLPISPRYWHIGDVYAIDREGKPRVLGAREAFRLGLSSWFGAVSNGVRRIGEEYGDHRMTEYKTALLAIEANEAV